MSPHDPVMRWKFGSTPVDEKSREDNRCGLTLRCQHCQLRIKDIDAKTKNNESCCSAAASGHDPTHLTLSCPIILCQRVVFGNRLLCVLPKNVIFAVVTFNQDPVKSISSNGTLNPNVTSTNSLLYKGGYQTGSLNVILRQDASVPDMRAYQSQ
jgi:hypothetical protein